MRKLDFSKHIGARLYRLLYFMPIMPTSLAHEVVINAWQIYLSKASRPYIVLFPFTLHMPITVTARPLLWLCHQLVWGQDGGEWKRAEADGEEVTATPLCQPYRANMLFKRRKSEEACCVIFLNLANEIRVDSEASSMGMYLQKDFLVWTGHWSFGGFWGAGMVFLGRSKRELSK